MENEQLVSTIKEAFSEIYRDLDKLVFIANNANVFNQLEVSRIEKNIKQNVKAIEYILVSQKVNSPR
ncbi:hypothetical protein [Metabacillus sediminilitoris]|uniref:Uncharacterized protein n=1 Tax=Metabacillus sediminilitoris TaxID=2567941 RepID=A0A4S4BMH9_9BACI|nr:hypothetical protein [Metabacillus sediminilitoris]QGQ46607.1 hypothetical protein GMB29_16105 [Metabacillus sediminilitoris]THF76004.1 hypothetical protein E6W99_22610 [Metabacillus sediminilitoris]